jgi:hypothetical protein
MPGITYHTPTRSSARVTVHREIHNDNELFAAIDADLRNAISATLDDIFSIFLTNYVQKYAYTGSNAWYIPSGEFLSAWRTTQVRKAGNSIGGTIIYDPKGMTYDFDIWKHGSQFEKWGTAVPYMADILNTKGPIGMPWNYREEAFWDKFVEDIFDSGEIDRIFGENYGK